MKNKTRQNYHMISLLPIALAVVAYFLNQIPFLFTAGIGYGLLLMVYLPHNGFITEFYTRSGPMDDGLTQEEQRHCFTLLGLFALCLICYFVPYI